jgi:uncharacterized membrane protein YhaH (DUF805 family)
MASITATSPAIRSGGARWALLLVGVTAAGVALMFVVGELVKAVVAGGHGQFHALFAAVFLAPALALAIRRPRGGAASTPAIIGLTIAALSQLIEGVGGFGYGPDNDSRVNALAQVHDLGVTIAPVIPSAGDHRGGRAAAPAALRTPARARTRSGGPGRARRAHREDDRDVGADS